MVNVTGPRGVSSVTRNAGPLGTKVTPCNSNRSVTWRGRPPNSTDLKATGDGAMAWDGWRPCHSISVGSAARVPALSPR